MHSTSLYEVLIKTEKKEHFAYALLASGINILTFSIRPDEVATVWWLQKVVYMYFAIALFQQIRSYHNMEKNKVSNLFT